MALLFCDSFDHYTTLLQKWTSTVFATSTSAGNGRNGTASYRSASSNHGIRKFLGASPQTLIAGVAFRTPSATTATIIVGFLDAATLQCEVRLNASSQLTICRNGAVLATSTNALVADTWYYIEFKAYIHDTAGNAEIKVNGVSWVSVSDTDTKTTANAYADTVQLGVTTPANVDWDDLYVCDTTGTYNNDYLGDIRVQAILPSGVGAQAEWDPSAGANWQCVDEPAPNADTDYVSTDAAGERDSYAFGDLAPAAGSIKAVIIYPRARKDDAGSRSIAPVVRIGGANYDGDAQSIGDTYAYYRQIYEASPATAVPWTIGEVNGAEFGVKLVE